MMTEEMINAAHAEAHCQSGPRKGKLKKQCPPMGTAGAAYWQACMMAINPFKVGIGHMIFMSPEHRELFDVVHEEASKLVKRRHG